MGRASRSAGTHTQCSSAPTSMPAAWGWMIGMFSGAGVCFLPFFAIGSSSLGSRGESKILLRKDTLGGGALRGARLFHLDRTSAERWREANMELNSQKRLCQACEQRGMALSTAQRDSLTHYLTLLRRWRPHLNLTGLRDAERMLEVLIVESLDFLQGDFFLPGMYVLDLGTGAGVPGIPLAICRPDIHVTLLDRSEKKITFLRRVVASLHLENCQPCCSTAEDLARRLPPEERFDIVVSRGVGSVSYLMRLTASLLKPGGLLLLRKPLHTPELQEAELLRTSQTWGSIETLPLPWSASPPWVLLSIVRGLSARCCSSRRASHSATLSWSARRA